MLKIRVKSGPQVVFSPRGIGMTHETKWFFVVLCELWRQRRDSNGWLEVKNEELQRLSSINRTGVWRVRRLLVKAGLIEEE